MVYIQVNYHSKGSRSVPVVRMCILQVILFWKFRIQNTSEGVIVKTHVFELPITKFYIPEAVVGTAVVPSSVVTAAVVPPTVVPCGNNRIIIVIVVMITVT